jgi:hypothetical protein
LLLVFPAFIGVYRRLIVFELSAFICVYLRLKGFAFRLR